MAALDEPAAIALPMGMLGLTLLDGIAFAYFVIAWATYAWIVEIWGGRQRGLTAIMTDYRHRWMAEMLVRPNRIVDTQINMTLQQGSSFFASTSLLAVGACLGLMNSTDKAVEVMQSLSFGHAGSRQQWEVKLAGLMVIFVYAFFKFGWAYRVFNYCAILIGATPEGEKRNSEEAKAMAARAAKMNSIAASARSSSRSAISAGSPGPGSSRRRRPPSFWCSTAASTCRRAATRSSNRASAGPDGRRGASGTGSTWASSNRGRRRGRSPAGPPAAPGT
jgi:uncharacterized membrane protein